MKSNTFHMSMLFDFYGELLTEKQKELFDLYYNEDLSLTEIAEHAGISRQGVRDAIVRSETILRDTEDKLGLVKKYGSYESKLDEIRDFIINDLHSGATLYESVGAYNYTPQKEIIAIVDKNEYRLLMDYIARTDPAAFITVYPVNEVLYRPKTQ